MAMAGIAHLFPMQSAGPHALWRLGIGPLFALLIACFAAGSAEAASHSDPIRQHSGAPCAACHLASDATKLENAHELTMTQERLCGRCHEGAIEASHPSGFVPGRPLPAAFPLNELGEMTCSTCHKVHKEGTSSLRVAENGRDFCQSCHDPDFFDRMPERGLALTRSGHLDAHAERIVNSVDPYTTVCIQCHEANASLSGFGNQIASIGFSDSRSMNHPIGSDYRQLQHRRGLRPAATLPANMLLPGGKVGCLSCHRGYGREHGALVAVSDGLCQTCHDK